MFSFSFKPFVVFLNTAAKIKDYDQRLKTLRKHQTAAYTSRADNKSKALWRVIDNERKPKSSTDNQVHLQSINEPCELANCFNNYFATIAENTLQTNKICKLFTKIGPSWQMKTFDQHHIMEVLNIKDTLNPKIFVWHQWNI